MANLSVTGGSVNTVVHGLLMGHATVPFASIVAQELMTRVACN